jgi:4-aminobutyrate aminotransferase-like enzyme
MIGIETGGELPARDLAERLRESGVLVGVTGPGGATREVRPPLIWTTEHVATSLAAFDAATARRPS